MNSKFKSFIAFLAIAVLSACGKKDEAGGPNIEMPAVSQPKSVAQPVIDAPQAEEVVKLAVPLEQFKVISTEEELAAVEAAGNYVAVTNLIRAVNNPHDYRPGDTEYLIQDNLVSGYEPIFRATGWRLDFDGQAESFNKVPGDLSRMNDAGNVRVYFMVKGVYKGPQIVEANIAAIEILDLDGKVIAKKSL
jgi:predicted small lipoprotein YifL